MKWDALQRRFAAIDALSRRDRGTLLVGGLALVAAVEIQVVLPLHDQRVAAELQQSSSSQVLVDQANMEAMQVKLKALKEEWARRENSPLRRAQSSSPQALFAHLQNQLALQGVEILSLHALPDSEPQEVGAATPADPAAAANAVPASAAPKAYRHRAELKLTGSLPEISKVLRELEREDQSMRLERVQLSAQSKGDGTVLATLTLVSISEDPSWLAM